VIYTSFLVWFVVFAERNKPQAAALMFGLAFSFKAQAMFLSPVLLYLLLSRRMKLWHATVIPLTYLFLMIPAAIAGRPWKQLVLVYFHQTNLVHLLSLSSPNPWWVFQSIVDYQTGLVIGLLLGAACALTIALWAWRSRPPVLLVASLSALVLPFVLPKMTERYFFVADVMTFALAFRVPRMWPVAALVQVASVLCVLPYLTYTPTTIYGVVPMTIAVGIMIALALGEYPLHRPVLFRGDRTRTTNAI
jgi:Gpi18-like mannosyltransferase